MTTRNRSVRVTRKPMIRVGEETDGPKSEKGYNARTNFATRIAYALRVNGKHTKAAFVENEWCGVVYTLNPIRWWVI